MEAEDTMLKVFFDESYLSSNPSSKNKDLQKQVKSNSDLYAISWWRYLIIIIFM